MEPTTCLTCKHCGPDAMELHIRCDHPSRVAIEEPDDSSMRVIHITFGEFCSDFEAKEVAQ